MNDAITLLSTPPPELSEAAVADIPDDLYGIEGSLKNLISERDQNFLVERKSGASFVFKIASSAEKVGVTRLQNDAHSHIEEKVTSAFLRVCGF